MNDIVLVYRKQILAGCLGWGMMVRYSWTKAWLPACCVREAGHKHINENNIRRIGEGPHHEEMIE